MRLIDALPLEKTIIEWQTAETIEPLTKTIVDNVGTIITHALTIEAIPIEWIENKIADIKKRPDDDYSISDCYELRISEVWLWLLEFWKEENQ